MVWLFALTVLISASLLFSVQPICARAILPLLGGTPAVWNTCMLFFQAGLLCGYLYSHLLAKLARPRVQVVLHIAMLVICGCWLPPRIADSLPGDSPILWLLSSLLLGVGPVYLLVSSGAPLLQHWFSLASAKHDPYLLYAASNIGSFGALLAYPFVIEPLADLETQTLGWAWGYLGLALLTALCGAATWRRTRSTAVTNAILEPVGRQGDRRPATRLRWIALALVPSSLMLSVTRYLTTDIAPIPLLWMLPLALYLLTFTVAFTSPGQKLRQFLVRWTPAIVLIVIFTIQTEGTEPLSFVLALHLVGFFWIALMCHSELAASKPEAAQLTEFYLWIALGGVCGGALNTLLAPLLFSSNAEYPLMLVAACLLRPNFAADSPKFRREGKGNKGTISGILTRWRGLAAPIALGLLTLGLILVCQWSSVPAGPPSVAIMFAVPMLGAYMLNGRALVHGLSVGAILLASTAYYGVNGKAIYRARSFFGIHRVTEADGARKLLHGNIEHGREYLDPARRDEPLTYYSRQGPCGSFFRSFRADSRLDRVGLVGLGAGSLASYAQHGQRWTYFEIDPAVDFIARKSGLFHFIADSRGTIDVTLGDARVSLSQRHDEFGVLVLDAFGSDAIPVHLLTREAIEIDLERLQPKGVLLVHISNLYLDLEPLLGNTAKERGLTCLVNDDRSLDDAEKRERSPSIWVAIARAREDLAALDANWRPARIDARVGVWSDRFSNLWSVFRWRKAA